MSTIKTFALAAALLAGAASMAMAQSQPAGSPGNNAKASGGSSTHQSAPVTGSSANTQKVIKNQNGYKPQ
jgi:hypothetical protein